MDIGQTLAISINAAGCKSFNSDSRTNSKKIFDQEIYYKYIQLKAGFNDFTQTQFF